MKSSTQFRIARTWASNFGSRSNRNSAPHLLHFPAQDWSSCWARITTPHTSFRGIRWRVMATNWLPVVMMVPWRDVPGICGVTSGECLGFGYENATIRVNRSRGGFPLSHAPNRGGVDDELVWSWIFVLADFL